MSNGSFITALRYRYYMRNIYHVNGSKCNCGRSVPLDVYGHHLATCCNKGGERIQTHDGIVHELNSILGYCGLNSKLEVRNVFKELDINDNSRADIVIYNPSIISASSNLLLDVSVTTPSTSVVRLASSSVFNAKLRKYSGKCNRLGYGFIPLIIESNGYLHKSFIDLLYKLSIMASSIRRISSNILYTYFIKRISLRLMAGVANSIMSRSSEVNCKTTLDASFNGDVINSM